MTSKMLLNSHVEVIKWLYKYKGIIKELFRKGDSIITE